jgi:hypothetical protein
MPRSRSVNLTLVFKLYYIIYKEFNLRDSMTVEFKLNTTNRFKHGFDSLPKPAYLRRIPRHIPVYTSLSGGIFREEVHGS